jgi:hypothetical protein
MANLIAIFPSFEAEITTAFDKWKENYDLFTSTEDKGRPIEDWIDSIGQMVRDYVDLDPINSLARISQVAKGIFSESDLKDMNISFDEHIKDFINGYTSPE